MNMHNVLHTNDTSKAEIQLEWNNDQCWTSKVEFIASFSLKKESEGEKADGDLKEQAQTKLMLSAVPIPFCASITSCQG